MGFQCTVKENQEKDHLVPTTDETIIEVDNLDYPGNLDIKEIIR